MTTKQRRLLWAILTVGFAVRLGWALYARAKPPFDFYKSGDQFSYYYYGQEIAKGRGYISYVTHQATAYYPIGFPALLGGIYFVLLHTPFHDDLFIATLLMNVLLGTASLALIFVVGRSFGGVRLGLLAAALMAAFPGVVYQVATLQLETTFIFCLLVCLAVITDHDWQTGPPTRPRLIAFGAALGVAILVRPFAAVLFLGLLGALWALRLGWRRTLIAAATVAGVVLLVSLPWTIRNAMEMHAFVPSSTNMGDTLCLDRNMDAAGGFRFSEHDGCVEPTLPEVERNRGNTRKAIGFVVRHPRRELLQIARRARIMFGGDSDGLEAVQALGSGAFLDPGVLRVATWLGDWYFFGVVGLAIAGLPTFAARRARPQRLVVLSGLVGLLIIPLLLWGNQRFHLPLAPFLVLSAGAALIALADRRASRAT